MNTIPLNNLKSMLKPTKALMSVVRLKFVLSLLYNIVNVEQCMIQYVNPLVKCINRFVRKNRLTKRI